MDLSKCDELNHENPKPARAHGSSTTSLVWKYFKLNADNPIQATCQMCGILMSRGGVSPSRCGTTNLRRHLSFAHGITLPSKPKQQRAVHSVRQQDIPKRTITQKPKQKKPLVPPIETFTFDQSLPYEICLRWKSYHTNMQMVFPSLLNNEHFVDVTLACEGRSIKCHRVILSACSSYFEEILCHTPCQHPIIIIKDLRFQELRTLVDFMYRGEVYVAQERLPTLIAAAEALQIKGLSGPSSTTSSSYAEDIFPTSSKDESKYLKLSDEEKSTVHGNCQTFPGTSSPLKTSSKIRPNGIQHILNAAPKSSSLNRYPPKHTLQTAHNKKILTSQEKSINSFLSRPLQLAKPDLQEADTSDESLDPSLRLENRSEPCDVIMSNDSICPAPICELSDQESVNTNGEGDHKSWSVEHDMTSQMDDDTENEGSSQGLIMVPEVVMDCSENSNST